MFKSASDFSGTAPAALRSKEARELRESLSGAPLSLSAAVLEALLPSKAGVEVTKLRTKACAFGSVGSPAAFVTADPRARVAWSHLPTLAGALWRLPPGVRADAT